MEKGNNNYNLILFLSAEKVWLGKFGDSVKILTFNKLRLVKKGKK